MPTIIPIKELKNTSDISELCHRTEGPIFITKNGYGDMVIMSMEMYEKTMNLKKMYQELEVSEQQISNGTFKDAKESIKNIKEKYGL